MRQLNTDTQHRQEQSTQTKSSPANKKHWRVKKSKLQRHWTVTETQIQQLRLQRLKMKKRNPKTQQDSEQKEKSDLFKFKTSKTANSVWFGALWSGCLGGWRSWWANTWDTNLDLGTVCPYFFYETSLCFYVILFLYSDCGLFYCSGVFIIFDCYSFHNYLWKVFVWIDNIKEMILVMTLLASWRMAFVLWMVPVSTGRCFLVMLVVCVMTLFPLCVCWSCFERDFFKVSIQIQESEQIK